jgi:outer membrane biosynthesis protein TonB
MTDVSQRAWIGSVALHGAALLLLLIGTWWLSREPERAHVFELVAFQPVAETPTETEPPPSPTVEPEVTPEPDEALEVPLIPAAREVPNLPPLRPTPPRVEPTPTPLAEPEPEVTRFEDFRRANPATPSRPRPAPRPSVSRPTIDLDPVAVPTVSTSPLQPDASALAAWVSGLRRQLNAAWDEPELVGPLTAIVRLEVTAQAELRFLGLAQSSGSAAFDESLRAIFRRLRTVTPPPSGQTETARMTFRIE